MHAVTRLRYQSLSPTVCFLLKENLVALVGRGLTYLWGSRLQGTSQTIPVLLFRFHHWLSKCQHNMKIVQNKPTKASDRHWTVLFGRWLLLENIYMEFRFGYYLSSRQAHAIIFEFFFPCQRVSAFLSDHWFDIYYLFFLPGTVLLFGLNTDYSFVIFPCFYSFQETAHYNAQKLSLH